jgi:hypothetical protein
MNLTRALEVASRLVPNPLGGYRLPDDLRAELRSLGPDSPLPADWATEAEALRARGLPLLTISNQLGVPYGRVQRHFVNKGQL